MDTSTFLDVVDEGTSFEDIRFRLEKYPAETRLPFMEEIIDRLNKKLSTNNESLLKVQEINQTMSRVISLASHEFRSPLSSIQLSAALIQRYYDRLDRDKILAHLSKIQSAVMEMNATVNDFLLVENIGAGETMPLLTTFDLKSLASEVTQDMQLMLQDNQSLEYKHRGLQSKVLLDRNWIKHCIVNLLSNAIRYSGSEGKILLETEIRCKTCVIRVKDDGIGIPKKDQPRIFEPFYRADNASNIPGTGLGLHIVDRFVRQLNGMVHTKSRLHMGSTFTLIFNI